MRHNTKNPVYILHSSIAIKTLRNYYNCDDDPTDGHCTILLLLRVEYNRNKQFLHTLHNRCRRTTYGLAGRKYLYRTDRLG